ncbi:MAG TPA: hypothetical protein VL689_22020 [Paraburkholderia sp.]|jgi:hypothetical protein|nr:hypothetical protein [Paraburkholderia sp.]
METDALHGPDALSGFEVDIDALYADMNRTGVGTLHNVIPPAFLEQMRRFVGEELERRGGQYFGLDRADGVEDSPLLPVIRHPDLNAAVRALYERGMGKAPPHDRLFPVLRVLAGSIGVRHAHLYHYDSYVVTALVPILIPDRPNEPPGHLVMYPNLRRERHFMLANVLEKAVMESKLARKLWRTGWMQRALGARIVPLTPGNVYFFWGRRSLHANEACLPTSVRCTALLHFGDPHENSPLKRLSQSLHRRSLKRLAHAR